MRRSALVSLLLMVSLSLSAETTTLCVVDLNGYAAYQREEYEFRPDRLSNPVVIQISDEVGVLGRISVMGWEFGTCSLVLDLTIVCAKDNTIETYVISDDGTVFYTKSSRHPVIHGVKALVGRIGAC